MWVWTPGGTSTLSFIDRVTLKLVVEEYSLPLTWSRHVQKAAAFLHHKIYCSYSTITIEHTSLLPLVQQNNFIENTTMMSTHNPIPILSRRAVLACSDDGSGHLCYPLRCPHHSQHLAHCIFISEDQSSPQTQVSSIICTCCLLVNFHLLAGLVVSLWSARIYPPPTKNLAEAWRSCVQRSGGRAQCLWKEAYQSRERWEVCFMCIRHLSVASTFTYTCTSRTRAHTTHIFLPLPSTCSSHT